MILGLTHTVGQIKQRWYLAHYWLQVGKFNWKAFRFRDQTTGSEEVVYFSVMAFCISTRHEFSASGS